MTPTFENDGSERDAAKQAKTDHERHPRPERFNKRDRPQLGQRLPPRRVRRAKHRAHDKGSQGDQHSGVAPADCEERSGRARATKLHPDPKQKGANDHGDTERADVALIVSVNIGVPDARIGKNNTHAMASSSI